MTKYLYTGSAVLMTTDNAGIKTIENVLTPGGTIIASQRLDINGTGTGWYSYNYDVRSSTTSILDDTGSLQNGYEYDELYQLLVIGKIIILSLTTHTTA